MPKYNIIYTSPASDTFLWNGLSFDKLPGSDDEALFFSGRSIETDDLQHALKNAQAAAHLIFTDDKEPKIEPVEIKTS